MNSNNSAIQKSFTSVIRVRVNSDLSLCKVYVSVLGKGYDVHKAFLAIKALSSYVRKKLSYKLNLRHTPKIEFYRDETLDYSEKIERLLRASNKCEVL